MQTLGSLDAVELSSTKGRTKFDVELRRYRTKSLARANAGRHRTTPGKVVPLAPQDWNSLAETTVERSLRTP